MKFGRNRTTEKSVHTLDVSDTGLAAARVSKPTVAQYTLYFRYLQTGFLANGSGSYGEVLRHHVMVVYRNFPEKSILMGENMARNLLKRRHLSSTSFPKTPVLGKVCCSSCSPTVALLP
jgi:hypothetical protein